MIKLIRMDACTFLAVSTAPTAIAVGIFLGVLVASGAVGLCSLSGSCYRAADNAAIEIHGAGHGFEVIWVDTTPHTTKVV
jgi:hypothetical protein